MLLAAHVLVLVAIAAALVVPGLRRRVALGLAAVAAACGAAAVVGLTADPRTLTVTTRFSAYVGNRLAYKDFEIETTEAPAWAWAAVAAGFVAVWAAVIHVLRRPPGAAPGRTHPFWVPMLLAWSGCGLVLALQKLAAPPGLVSAYAFDAALLPATLAAALLLAARCNGIVLTLAWLSLFVTMTRVPLALLATVATREHWGTSLDVHAIEHFAEPIRQRSVIVEPGSNEQLLWLVWLPQLLVFPALYMLSCSGVAVARVLVGRAGPPEPG